MIFTLTKIFDFLWLVIKQFLGKTEIAYMLGKTQDRKVG